MGFCDENPDLCSSYISSSAHNDTANSTTTSQMSSSDSTLLGVFLGLALSIIFVAMLCVFYMTEGRGKRSAPYEGLGAINTKEVTT